MPSNGDQTGVVAIGRNEGERLRRCLRSALRATSRVVYVDSGSTDDSVEFAKTVGVGIVVLDTSVAFTAARARNAGVELLLRKYPDVRFLQLVDGDCELNAAWIDFAGGFLERNTEAGVACGRRRERHPKASVYNRLCDLKWDSPIGIVRSCGGDAMFRREAFDAAGGYDASLIAGEEPELCVRIRALGWTVHRLDHEMTLHDAAMTRFHQFWRRCMRAGHAYAQGASMHGSPPERHCVKQRRSALVWGLLLPGLALGFAVPTCGVAVLAYAGLWVLQWVRIGRRALAVGRSRTQARLLATFTMFGKYAEAVGALLFYWRRLTGRKPTLIEYKGSAS